MAAAKHNGLAWRSGDGPSDSEIREHLRRILDSRAFRGSRRCIAFLEYAVEKTLAGQAEALKERNLAVDVFERSPDTNLTENTIVRVGAREVRKRLAQYYMSREAAGDTVIIDLPPGSYVPEFRYLRGETQPAASAAEPEHPAASPVAEPSSRVWVLAIAGVLLIAVVAAVAVVVSRPGPDEVAFRQFWKPLLGDGDWILLAVAHPLVYHPSARITRLNDEMLPPEELPLQRSIQLPPRDTNGADWIPVFDQYVGFGDLQMAADLATFLARHGKSARVRLATKVEFADFKDAPAILIGAYTNQWTLRLGKDLRFRFVLTADGVQCVRDSADPRRAWRLPPPAADGSFAEDFLVVTRLAPSPAGKPMLMVGGLKQFGTEAGGRLLVSPEELGPLLRKLPPDWSRKQLQLVLRASVIGNTPAAPEILAWHVW